MKPKLKFLDLATLTQIQILSNTPGYLYKHFKNDPSLRAFAESCSVDNLTDFVASLVKRKHRSGNYHVLLYAIAVSLSFKEYGDIRQLLDQLGKIDIKWLPRLVQLIQSSLVTTSSQTHNLHFQVSTQLGSTNSTGSTKAVLAKQSPKLFGEQV